MRCDGHTDIYFRTSARTLSSYQYLLVVVDDCFSVDSLICARNYGHRQSLLPIDLTRLCILVAV